MLLRFRERSDFLYFKRPASTEADPLVNDERPDPEVRAFALVGQRSQGFANDDQRGMVRRAAVRDNGRDAAGRYEGARCPRAVNGKQQVGTRTL